MQKTTTTRCWILALLTAALLLGVVACGSDSDSDADDMAQADVVDVGEDGEDGGEDVQPEASGPEVLEITASEAYRQRQADYLQRCHDENGPGQGGWHGQNCRIALGATTYNEDKIDEALAKLTTRGDTADFALNSLLRMLYLDRREGGVLPEALRTRIEDAVLGFKYWINEPGEDQMCYWTENHQVLYHAGELLAGQLFPDRVFTNNGMTGAEHAAHARPYLDRWLHLRGHIGFSEWHSNVYFNEDMPPLVSLVDFAEDPELQRKAAMVLDVLALDLLNNMYKGLFATTHGRTYDSKLVKASGLQDSTRSAAWVMLGLGENESWGDFTGSFLATSEAYHPPKILEDLAEATRERHLHRQRDSINVSEGPEWDIGYEDFDDIVVWAGMAGIVAPEVIDGMVAMLDEWELWNGFLFGMLPEEVHNLLVAWKGTPKLKELATNLEPMSRGMALERVNTYTWRTPDYQLSGAQDCKPGFWGTQTHMWQATLDRKAYVFTAYPEPLDGLDLGPDFASPWTGGWLPRVSLHENVGVIQYRKQENLPLVGPMMKGEVCHAYVPTAGFDEIEARGHWIFGRKGDAYLGLWSQHEPSWGEDPELPNEWKVTAPDNVWVVELGSKAEQDYPDFDTFKDALEAGAPSVDEETGLVSYLSPTQGQVEVAWEGSFKVEDQDIDLGPYERFDNEMVQQTWGEGLLKVELGAERLELDFKAWTRDLYAVP